MLKMNEDALYDNYGNISKMLRDKDKAQNSVFSELHFSIKEGRSKLLVVFQGNLSTGLLDVATCYSLHVDFPFPISAY